MAVIEFKNYILGKKTFQVITLAPGLKNVPNAQKQERR
jgi:hypothetical protein